MDEFEQSDLEKGTNVLKINRIANDVELNKPIVLKQFPCC